MSDEGCDGIYVVALPNSFVYYLLIFFLDQFIFPVLAGTLYFYLSIQYTRSIMSDLSLSSLSLPTAMHVFRQLSTHKLLRFPLRSSLALTREIGVIVSSFCPLSAAFYPLHLLHWQTTHASRVLNVTNFVAHAPSSSLYPAPLSWRPASWPTPQTIHTYIHKLTHAHPQLQSCTSSRYMYMLATRNEKTQFINYSYLFCCNIP